MPLSAVNMVQNGHLIHQDIKQFVDILTGIMVDQPVTVSNSVTTQGASGRYLTEMTPIGTGNYLSVVQPPGYTFTGDPHSGFYLNAMGEPGIMTNWNDGSNEGFPTFQFRQWLVNGAAPAQGGRMIIMPRNVGIGWTGNQGSVDDTDGLIFFGNDSSQNVVALRSDMDYWGASLRIYGRYNKNNFDDSGYFEMDFISSPPFGTNKGAMLLTTVARGRAAPDLNIAPGGVLRLGTGSVIRWGLDPNDSSGGSAFHPFGNAALGTSDFNTLSTVFTNNVSLQQTNQPATVMQVWGGKYAPTNPLGVDGDWFFRGDTPGVTNQQIYQKVSGVWTPLTTGGGGGGTTSILVFSQPAVTGTTVTLPQIPATNGVFEVSVNGQAQMPGRDWTVSGNVITFTSALTADDVLVTYQVAPFNPAQVSSHYETTLAPGTTTFNLPAAPQGVPLLTRGGVVQYQSQGHYSVSGSTVTLGVAVNGTEDGHFSVDYITGGGTDAGSVGGVTVAQLIARTNLITNGGFEVWQRGTNAIPVASNGVFTADRWQGFILGTSTLTVTADASNQDAGSWRCAQCVVGGGAAPGAGAFIYQNLIASFAAGDGQQLRGRTVSYSVRVKSSVPNAVRALIADATAGVNHYSAYHSGSGQYETLTCTIQYSANCTNGQVQVVFEANGTYYVDNAVAVVSSVPVDYTPLHPADDLLRCQRYLYRESGAGGASHAPFMGFSQSATSTFYPVRYPVPFPVTPTLTFSALADWTVTNDQLSASVAANLIQVNNGNNQHGLLQVGTATSTGATVGTPRGLSAANANAWIQWEGNP